MNEKLAGKKFRNRKKIGSDWVYRETFIPRTVQQ